MNHLKGILEQVNHIRAICRDIYDFANITGRMHYNLLKVCRIISNKAKRKDSACQ